MSKNNIKGEGNPKVENRERDFTHVGRFPQNIIGNPSDMG